MIKTPPELQGKPYTPAESRPYVEFYKDDSEAPALEFSLYVETYDPGTGAVNRVGTRLVPGIANDTVALGEVASGLCEWARDRAERGMG